MEYLIRNCEKKDLKTVVSLCVKHSEYEQAEYNPEGKEGLLTEILFSENPKLFCLVVQSGEKIVGYSTYTLDCSTWDAAFYMYMDCLYLEPEYRGFNIGEVMIKRLVAIAEENKCVNVQWHTPDFNERAIKFYRRIGAAEKKKMRFYIATDV
jgi:ribosomal protein S18 acetylase RimI-like enzyme